MYMYNDSKTYRSSHTPCNGKATKRPPSQTKLWMLTPSLEKTTTIIRTICPRKILVKVVHWIATSCIAIHPAAPTCIILNTGNTHIKIHTHTFAHTGKYTTNTYMQTHKYKTHKYTHTHSHTAVLTHFSASEWSYSQTWCHPWIPVDNLYRKLNAKEKRTATFKH